MADSTKKKNPRARTVSQSTSDLSSTDLKHRLQQMDDYDFEHLIADLWEQRGWQTTVKQQSNDGGVDVVAKRREPFMQKWLIQAKCYSSSLGAPRLRKYAILQHRDGVDAAVVVSTAGFTKSAQKESQQQNLKLIDGGTLINMIDDMDAYDILDGYNDLQPEPIVETIPDPESESVTTGVGNTIFENENKSIQIHDLSEREVAKRVGRIDSEEIHPNLSFFRRKFLSSNRDHPASESQASSSVWERTLLAKAQGDEAVHHKYVNRAFGGGCTICGTFASLRVVGGSDPVRKAECIKCESRFSNKNAGNGYKDKAEWGLIWGGNSRLGEKNFLKEWREEFHEQKMQTYHAPDDSRNSPSFYEQARRDDPETEIKTVTAADTQCHNLTEEEIADRVNRIEKSDHPVWKNFISGMNDGSWLISKLSKDSVWKGTDLEESGNNNLNHRLVNRIFQGRCAVCGGFASLRDVSGGFFSKMASRKVKCVECDAKFESETADSKSETEWKLIEGPNDRVGERKSLKRWIGELFEQ